MTLAPLRYVVAAVVAAGVGCVVGYPLGVKKNAPLDDVPLFTPMGARVVAAVKGGDVVGVKVFGIAPHSALADLGLANGDVVLSVDGRPLRTVGDAPR